MGLWRRWRLWARSGRRRGRSCARASATWRRSWGPRRGSCRTCRSRVRDRSLPLSPALCLHPHEQEEQVRDRSLLLSAALCRSLPLSACTLTPLDALWGGVLCACSCGRRKRSCGGRRSRQQRRRSRGRPTGWSWRPTRGPWRPSPRACTASLGSARTSATTCSAHQQARQQLVESEQYHIHIIQQLQREVADLRGPPFSPAPPPPPPRPLSTPLSHPPSRPHLTTSIRASSRAGRPRCTGPGHARRPGECSRSGPQHRSNEPRA